MALVYLCMLYMLFYKGYKEGTLQKKKTTTKINDRGLSV